ncbi:CoA transferase [Nocardia sp. NPDC047648]|uniref:CaiB/BaiF CoA transferase family protein n=1 Tax=Nocardia sp. NPDC047648 TaxID=3155625 RepID=UPI0033E6DAC3
MMCTESLKVVDAATLFAGPLAATMLADYGADVIKVEHPRHGDPSRGHGPSKGGVGLVWKQLGRNKRPIGVDLSTAEGQSIALALLAEADVLIENFRPGTLERWNLGPDVLQELNPRLVIARVTAFGQSGPRAHEPGFGTLAEAMSGFAAMTGEPDGPPTLPPLALADGIAALATAFAVMVALRQRDHTGRGQVIDLAIIEPILMVLGTHITVHDALGVVPRRTGNRSDNNAPRNIYRSRDGRWLAVSTSAQTIAERVMTLVGRPDLAEQPWFRTGFGRVQHVEEVDGAVAAWIAERDAAEVLEAFSEAQAAISPVYDIADIFADPQYKALETIVRLPDPDLGQVAMQNVLFRLSQTPGAIRWPGRAPGADTDEVLSELGFSDKQIRAWRDSGVIA